MILVTGSTGTVGTEVVKSLAARGAKVRAFARSREKAEEKFQGLEGVEIALGEFDDRASLAAALQGVEKVFILPPTDPKQLDYDKIVTEAAAQAGVRHGVKLSAMGADSDDPVLILRWHGRGEKALEDSGMAYTHLRANSFMQNFQFVVEEVKAADQFTDTFPAKTAKIDVRDIGEVAAFVMTEEGHENKSYELTGPEAISLWDMADILSEVVGRKITYNHVSPPELEQIYIDVGAGEFFGKIFAEIYGSGYYAEGKGARITSTVEDITGKAPGTFEQWCKDYVDWFKK